MTESKGGKAETLLRLRLPAPHTLVGHLSLPARLPKPLPRPVHKVVGFSFPRLFPMSFGFKQTCAKKGDVLKTGEEQSDWKLRFGVEVSKICEVRLARMQSKSFFFKWSDIEKMLWSTPSSYLQCRLHPRLTEPSAERH